MSGWRIAPAGPADAADRRTLARALWPDDAGGSPVGEAFVARDPADAAVGLAEFAVRHDHVNGCDGSPVLFLDGLFVVPAWRRRGLARALVAAVADWGRVRGLAEFASDAPLGNAASLAFHAAAGFAETERVVFFRQALAR